MSLPPVVPDKSAAGIAVDPVTLTRVIPQSRRPDGSLRKEIKIRPGFTPQEDVTRFRGTRQQQMDRNTLPKGHILGWVAPSSETKPKPKGEAVSKSAKKNEKRKAKREQQKQDIIRATWESDDDDDAGNSSPAAPSKKAVSEKGEAKEAKTDKPADDVDEVESKMKKLEVQ